MSNLIRKITIVIAVLGSSILWAQGTISGQVTFEGKAPRMRAIKMGADPVCSNAHATAVLAENVVVGENGALKNVLISIVGGLDGKKFPATKESVILDQAGCLYTPHVFGVMAGQPLEILNTDATLHNIHSLSKANKSFNMAMPKVVKKKIHTFTESEAPFKIKCDVHPWMGTWASVFDHPFFTVTDENGAFSLEGVPAGTYEVQAWHESTKRLPAQTQTVTVDDKGSATMAFNFKPVAKKKK